jgi:ribosomal protein S7
MIWRGRKLWAYNFMLNLKYELKLKENFEFHISFLFSLLNITPHIILSYLKIGGAKQGVPLAISWKKKITYAIKWMRIALKNKHKKIKLKFLLEELIMSIYNKGLTFNQKKRTYIEGFSNRFLLKRFKYKR